MAVLVVDDEKNIRDSIVRYLKLENIEAIPAENGLSAQRLLTERPFDAAVVDLKMPGMDGLALLAWIRNGGPDVPVIMISAYGEIDDAVNAMKMGARDYIVKPFDPEELVLRLKRLLEDRRNQDRVKSGQAGQLEDKSWIGTSPAGMEVKRLAEKVAAAGSTILITGESGTGKEVTARFIHAHSSGADHPFVPINLGGIPENLLESELFGYEQGAFTNAISRKAGLFELASGGTLFLDEIGEMPAQLQVKLLRFLQDKKIQRLGGTKTIPVAARIIAATNRDLKALVAEKKFREDLFFRLNVITIKLPALRERREDIPLLVGHFIRKFNNITGKKITAVSADALAALSAYPFPGNIRELENLIERAFILTENTILEIRDFDLPRALHPGTGNSGTMKELEKQAIIEALIRWEGNRTRVAGELGITRRTLFNKIREYGITPDKSAAGNS